MGKGRWRQIAVWGVIGAGLAGLIWVLMRPDPVPVDIGAVSRGSMMVTVNEEGRTRVKEVYVVSAPITGRLLRIDLHAGDEVAASKTLLARIEPADPDFLDIRTHAQAQANVKAAEAALALAEAERVSANAEYDFARSELSRTEKLAARGTVSGSQLDSARLALKTRKAAVDTAKANVRMKASQLETARALLLIPEGQGAGTTADPSVFPVLSPVDGRVLRVLQESEGVVPAGTPLLEIGDPANLELVIDVLSSDAVRIAAGAKVLIEAWGGGHVLEGRVERVEPFGFTKISALGVEEQRVNIIVELVSPRSEWRQLGHGFRVETRIVTWEGDDVLQVPVAALFRQGGKWAVFCLTGDVAEICPVDIGHLNDNTAEVVSGLEEGREIVLYPGDEVTAGGRVRPRRTDGTD